MKLFRRGPTRLERELAAADLEIAVGRAQSASQPGPSFAATCDRVRTPQGRRAHLKHPEQGVLCGWHGAEDEADLSLPLCRLCAIAAVEEKAAS